jgi:hypothetical protein
MPQDGSRVYGHVGEASVDLERVAYSDTITGSLDGRSVSLAVGDGRLSGSIGSSANVDLQKTSGYFFLPASLSGQVGNRSLSLRISGRNTYGSVGSAYYDTTISSDGKRLSGQYDGSLVQIRTTGRTTSGFLGRHAVIITQGDDGGLAGYVGSKSIDLRGDVGPGGLLRRLPLIAADNWLVISTLTKFFL